MALAESNQRLVTGAVLRSDRARLVLPVWLAPGSQCVAPLAAANPLAMVVPGVPESSIAYELTAGRLQPLRRKRETGGMRVTLEEFGLTALVLFAQDPLIIDAVTRRAAANGKLSAELERHLAAGKLDDGRAVSAGSSPPACRRGSNVAGATGRGAAGPAAVRRPAGGRRLRRRPRSMPGGPCGRCGCWSGPPGKRP